GGSEAGKVGNTWRGVVGRATGCLPAVSAAGADDLLPAEWAVLGVVASGPTHGYGVARALGEDGALGHVWTVPRPLVYRALQQLEQAGLVEAVGEEASASGPRRATGRATRRGRARLKPGRRAPRGRPRGGRAVP